MAGGNTQMNEKQLEHLNHPFYKDAEKYREDVRKGQILKGAEKYPKPFSPKDWTARELLLHAMQENVDQAHYIVGLAEKLEEYEALIVIYKEALRYYAKYDHSHFDDTQVAREALGLED